VKKILVFVLAIAFLMLIAIPATAGPPATTVLIGTAMPALLTAPAQAPIAPNVQPVVFEFSPPVLARTSPAASLIATTASPFKAIYEYAFLAALAGLTCGVGLSLITSYRRIQKASDRMHGLARDQDAPA